MTKLSTLLFTLVLIASTSAVEATPAIQERLVAKAKSLVRVRFVLKVQAGGNERELDSEATCLVIAAQEALLLCSNNELGGSFGTMALLVNRGQGPAILSTVKEIKVQIGTDSQGQSARLIARDSDRDLAWLRLDAIPAGAAIEALEVGSSETPPVGAPIFRLRRLDRFFGDQAVVESASVGALLEQPRRLILASDLDGGVLGAPVFDVDGKLVGITVAQLPSGEDFAGSAAGVRGLPGQSSRYDDMVGNLILPSAEIVKATALALEIEAADRAEAAAVADQEPGSK